MDEQVHDTWERFDEEQGPPNRKKTAQVESPWLSPVQAALYLGVALGTLRNWTSMKYVPHAKKGRVVRYHRDTLDRWLTKGACSGRNTIADINR